MQLTEKDLLPGTVVQHFKRGMLPESERADSAMYLYEILGVARHTETGEMLVVYRARSTASTGYAPARLRCSFPRPTVRNTPRQDRNTGLSR